MRFIINLPKEELESVERICFQVEEAQWFYEDFIRPLDPDLPSLNLKNFCLRIFQHCPLLSEFSSYHHAAAFSEFLAYKTRVPVRGAIMLNDAMDQVVLVKGWKKSANWSFPRGKINKGEADLDCAVREVYEETGFDLKDAGIVGNNEGMKMIELTMRDQHMGLFVFRGVPMNAQFKPRTRKEISEVQWYKLSELPTSKKQKQQREGRGNELAINANKFYMVAPFMGPLKKWISQQKKIGKPRKGTPSRKVSVAVADKPIKSIDQYAANGSTISSNVKSDGLSLNESLKDDLVSHLSDLPEVSEPWAPMKDGSAQLKMLLNIPPLITTEAAKQSGDNARAVLDTKSLLALLKPKGDKPEYESPPTLLNNAIESSSVDQALTSEHSRTKQLHEHPPLSTLPNLPLPNELTEPESRPTGALMSPLQSSANKLDQSPTVEQFSKAMPQVSLPKKSIDNHSPSQGYQKIPYQGADDLDFTQSSEIPFQHAPSIPSANELPPPKLTKHSSTLLGLFKSGQSSANHALISPIMTETITSEAEFISERKSDSAVITKTAAQSVVRDETRQDNLLFPSVASQKMGIVSPNPSHMNGFEGVRKANEHIHAPEYDSNTEHTTAQVPDVSPSSQPESASIYITGSDLSAKTRSEHQEALLSLFRPPVSGTKKPLKIPSQSLELPVELSALPSPGHSRETSRINISSLNESNSIFNRPSTAKGQPEFSSKDKKPSVFATVNGPLNVPQFEVLAKASRENISKPSAHQRSTASKKSPATTLSHPKSAERSLLSNHQAEQRLLLKPLLTVIKPPIARSKSEEKGHGIFQPKNSRKQTQTAGLAQEAAVHLPTKALSPSQSQSLDTQAKPPQDHKQTLLSLFNKPLTSTSPINLNRSSIISPISESRPYQQNPSPLITPLASKSQVGSVASAVGEGNGGSGRKRQGSRTAPANRDILLGYLNGVVNGEKR